MRTLSHEQLDWLIGLLRYWGDLVPSVKTLVVMIGLDILSGWLLAFAKRTLNSTTSWAGMMKKTMVLLLVAVAIVLEPYANGLPLSMLVALGFIVQEGLSILENAGALGIPLPAALVDVLEKMQKEKKGRLNQKSGNDDALNRNTEALNTRIAQVDNPVIPIPVIVQEPVKAEIINPPDHPANVTLQQ